MKKINQITFLLFCLLPFLCNGQDSKWIISFKTNLLNVEIEDDFYFLSGVFNSSGLQSRPYDIHRKSKQQLGCNFEMKKRFKVIGNYYWLMGFELRYSRFEKQEWLENHYKDEIYLPQFEIGEVVLDGKIDREILNMENHILGFNPYPKSKPYKLQHSFLTLDLPLNFHYSSKSDKLMVSSGLVVSSRINIPSNSSSKLNPQILKNPSLGVNLNVDFRFYKNWYISISYVNLEKGVYLPSQNYLKSKNQNIFSLGLSCLLRP